MISCSYPNVTLSKIELYASDPYSRAQEVLKVTLKAKFWIITPWVCFI